jgi:hypothetical protein
MDQGKKRGGTRGAAAAAAAASAPPPAAAPGPGVKRGRSEKDRAVLGVAFNREGSAPQLSISRDALEVAGDGKGYRMARANTGVREGHWCGVRASPPPRSVVPLAKVLLSSTSNPAYSCSLYICCALSTMMLLRYFELEVLPPPPGLPPGHVRVGWAAITGELQGPVG